MDITNKKRKSSSIIKSFQISNEPIASQTGQEKDIEEAKKEEPEKVTENIEIASDSKKESIPQVSKELKTTEIMEKQDEKSVVISEPTQSMMEEMQREEPKVSTKTKENEAMAFWKRGSMHIQDRTWCQDSAFCVGYDKKDPLYSKYIENHNKIKVVMDGCGSCEYSLIGVLMFEQEFKKRATEIEINPDNLEDIIKEIFGKMLQFDNGIQFILDNYLFTILICFEYEDRFEVCTCGDGFILYVYDGQIFFKELEGSEKNEEGKILPNYFAYDLDEVRGKLSNYKNGTEFELCTFEKARFSNVGVASDGLRFCKSLDSEEKSQLFSMIYYRLPIGLERFLEKHKGLFMDDFSISI